MNRRLFLHAQFTAVFLGACTAFAQRPSVSPTSSTTTPLVEPVVTTSQRTTAETKVPSQKAIAFVTVGCIDNVLAKRIMDLVAAELHCLVTAKQPIETAMTNAIEAQAASLSSILTDKDVCVVAIAEEPGKEHVFHGYLDNKLKVGIVNATTLKPANASTPEGSEAFARRLEKETMRTVGHLLGMESCAESHCALTPYPDLQGLDAMGRNFCPPCQMKAAERLGTAR